MNRRHEDEFRHSGQPADGRLGDLPDERCDAVDLAIDEALRETSPTAVPEGLVDRVLAASQPHLESGRTTSGGRLVFPAAARLAMAAGLMLAVGAAIWMTRSLSDPRVAPMPDVVAFESDEVPVPYEVDDPMERVRGMWRLHELDYNGAVTDLEHVVWAVQNGAASRLVLSPGETAMEAVENELDSVRVIARIDG